MLFTMQEKVAPSGETGVVHPMETLEGVCADAWPAVVRRDLGDWRMRAAGGYTGRANSTLAIGDPGLPLHRALDTVVAFSREHGIRPYLQVVSGSPVEEDLTDHGWRANTAHAKGAETYVLVGPTRPAPGDVRDTPPPGWLEVAVGGVPTRAQEHVLTTGPRVGFATVWDGDAIAGIARGCVVGAYLHVAVLEVRPEHRRRGHGAALLAALDHWAGTPYRVLQVTTANTAAVALYRRENLTESHRYRYWVGD
ncbi:N-acetyltransferase [Actinokineospora fastidiosa]|uniref:N-acetyltransferase n=2 Tax=Actinokineospora fastidiosa TaxID=1816 RepID=A0A918L688_9PSEU|nr:N-acetyltransferase [Actinokineospora fastidiosa]